MTASMNRVMQRITKGNPRRKLFITMALCVATLVAANWARARDAAEAVAAGVQEQFQFFSFMTSSHYATYERVALWCVLGVAFSGLAYAMMLIDEVKSADTGTPKMQAVADAVRAGANAYLATTIQEDRRAHCHSDGRAVLHGGEHAVTEKIALGRAGAFLMGSLFSFCVGFVGMRFATLGNLRVAAAARRHHLPTHCRLGTARARSREC